MWPGVEWDHLIRTCVVFDEGVDLRLSACQLSDCMRD